MCVNISFLYSSSFYSFHPRLVSAIHCWDCASNINPNCGDPFNTYSFEKVDCDQKVRPHLRGMNATLCRKIIQRSKFVHQCQSLPSLLKLSSCSIVDNNPVPRVVRTCGWISDDSTDGECIRRSGTFSVLVEYCTCSTDGCNGATGTYLSTGLAVATLMGLVVAWARV